jgi:quinol monooxygenase YgiN
MSIYVFASVTPKAEHLEAAEQILRAAVSESRKEAGCLRYDLFKTVQGETSFQFFEAYTDQAALIAHAQSAHFLTLKEQITPLLAQPLTISITSAVDVAA